MGTRQGLISLGSLTASPPTEAQISHALQLPSCPTGCQGLASRGTEAQRAMAWHSMGAGVLSYVTRSPLCLVSHNFLNLLGGWGKETLFCFGCEVLDALLPGLHPSDPSHEDRSRED